MVIVFPNPGPFLMFKVFCQVVLSPIPLGVDWVYWGTWVFELDASPKPAVSDVVGWMGFEKGFNVSRNRYNAETTTAITVPVKFR